MLSKLFSKFTHLTDTGYGKPVEFRAKLYRFSTLSNQKLSMNCGFRLNLKKIVEKNMLNLNKKFDFERLCIYWTWAEYWNWIDRMTTIKLHEKSTQQKSNCKLNQD